ncbi:MAG: HAD family hydrolase [Gemmatimonadetes bacterium]|nr:HAD family hydrolase [Gemmatimonadota bacterium]
MTHNPHSGVLARAQLAVTGDHLSNIREARAAVFLDRDGTLIQDVGYIKAPEQVELVNSAANAVRRLNYAMWASIIVTNQSGIARGLLTEADYRAVQARLDDLLAERGAFLDGHYFCPHHPDFGGPCECRKPGTALYTQAALELAVSLKDSVWVGDRWRDIAPALHFGGRGILVPNAATPPDDLAKAREQLEVAATLTDAVHMILHV